MVDMTAITGLATSIRAAVEIAKAMKDLDNAILLQTKTFELTREIMTAQGYAMETVAAQSALLQRVRELEEEKANLEAWNTEKARYKLTDVGRDLRAYTLKEGMENGELAHQACANCYNDRIISILQPEYRNPGMCKVLSCHRCGSDLYLSGSRTADHNSMRRQRR